MTQSRTNIMAATIRVSDKGLAIINAARRRRGWSKSCQEWADLATTSKATLKRFWSGLPIRAETFKEICFAAGVDDWQIIADLEIPSEKEINQHVNGSIKKKLVIELDADFESIDAQKLLAVIKQLSLMGDSIMKIVDVKEGSIKLIFEASSEDTERIQALIKSGEINDVLGIPIKKAYSFEEKENIRIKDTREALRERDQRLSNDNERGESQPERFQDNVLQVDAFQAAAEESNGKISRHSSIRFYKLQIEQLEDVFSAIIQGVSIVGGTTVSVFILNWIALDKEWLSWSNWSIVIWDISRASLLLLSILFVVAIVLFFIRSTTISLLSLEGPTLASEIMPLVSSFSNIFRLTANAAYTVAIGTVVLTVVIQLLAVLLIGSLNGVELSLFFGDNSFSSLNIIVAFSTGVILSILLLAFEISLARSAPYVASFSKFILTIPLIIFSLPDGAEDLFSVLFGFIGLAGFFVGIYWILLFILSFLGFSGDFASFLT